jgi:hypothetical protein
MTTRLQTLLSELELSELLPLFEAQGIDDAVLADLSDAELTQLGVEKLGDRKKLLKAFGESSEPSSAGEPIYIPEAESQERTLIDKLGFKILEDYKNLSILPACIKIINNRTKEDFSLFITDLFYDPAAYATGKAIPEEFLATGIKVDDLISLAVETQELYNRLCSQRNITVGY